ncbi:MAG: penicillin-binding protein 2, partial [Parcubacteria group bacterium]|nr:penicillin-binding protein 2 [Parcubacteria group bacterium]
MRANGEAGKMRSIVKIIPATRGIISAYDGLKELTPIAINSEKYLIYANPRLIENSTTTIQLLDDVFSLTDEEKIEIINKLLSKDRYYVILKRDIDFEKRNEIIEARLAGIGAERMPKRFYLDGKYLGHLTGFTRFDEDEGGLVGQYGVEEYLQSSLAGKSTKLYGQKMPGDILIASAEQYKEEGYDGSPVSLSIDRFIQVFICDALDEGIKAYQAESGSVIVMDPSTMRVKGLCNAPRFDPNEFQKIEDVGVFRNRSISDAFEPGSIFKVITMAAALDGNGVTAETSFVDSGQVKVDDKIIKNAGDKVYGNQTMVGVLEKSINTGAVFAAQKLGMDPFRNYVKEFGFGTLTGIEQPSEARGDVSSLDKKSSIYLATASFGQGISVTPMQMLTAFSALINGGKLIRPTLIESNGNEKDDPRARFARDVIRRDSSEIMKAILVSVIENGFSKRARIPGYRIGGKTGTAQVPKPDGKGYSEKTIHSFIGFGTQDNPRFAVLVKLDNPKIGKYAEYTAMPVFKKIAQFLIDYYKIPKNL